MKNVLIASIALLPLFALSCKKENCHPEGDRFYLNDTFTVCMKHRVALEDGGFEIKLLDVPVDGRCPVNAMCIWPGEAKAVLSFSKEGKTSIDTLRMPGMVETPYAADTALVFGRKVILLSVLPYPGTQYFDKDDYRVMLTVQ